jgi:hypothetical protein
MSIAAGDGDPYEIDAEVALRLALHRLGDAQVALALANAENAENVRNGLPPMHSVTEMRQLFLAMHTSVMDLQPARANVDDES